MRSVEEIRAAFAALPPAEPYEPCSSCHGDGKAFMFAHTAEGCATGWHTCLRCGGAARIDANEKARVTLGRQLRQERTLRGASLHEEAARLGVAAVVLSGWEFGRPEPRFVGEAPAAEER